jgi:hypothetical protein
VTSFGLKRWYEDAGFERIEIEPSSSSIYTCLWALKIAMQEEMDAGFPNNPIRQQQARLIHGISKQLIEAISALLDRGPRPGVQFPISWTAKGYKSGPRKPAPGISGSSKKAFLESHALPDACFSGDTLIFNEPPIAR